MQNRGMDRTRPPLRWMVLQARALGLRTKPFERELSRDEQIDVKESLTWVWKPFELYPWYRLTYTRRCDDGKETTRKKVFFNCEARPQLTFFLGLILGRAGKYMLIRRFMVLSCWPVS